MKGAWAIPSTTRPTSSSPASPSRSRSMPCCSTSAAKGRRTSAGSGRGSSASPWTRCCRGSSSFLSRSSPPRHSARAGRSYRPGFRRTAAATSSSPRSCSTSSPRGVMISLLAGPLIKRGQSSPTSRGFAESTQIPDMQEILAAVGIEAARSPLNLSFVLAIAACVFVWLLIWRTRFGFAVRTLGHSPQAAAYAGHPDPAHHHRRHGDLGRHRRSHGGERGAGGAAPAAAQLHGRLRVHRHRGVADGPQPSDRNRAREPALRRPVPGRERARSRVPDHYP